MWPAGRNCLKIAYAAKIVGRFLVGAGLKPAPGRLLQNGQVSNLPLQRCSPAARRNEATLLILVVRILGLLDSPRLKKTGRGRRPCRPELVDIFRKNVPARRPAPTKAQAAIGHYF